MVDIDSWMKGYIESLRKSFGERIRFVGLQGSYARGEASEKSDIDAVAILDAVTVGDIEAYGAMLDTLPNRELTCGFFGGMDELLNWEPSELFQFYHDTIPFLGSLDVLLDKIDYDTVDQAILQAACGAYHGCVHNMLFERDDAILAGLYKSASFAVQASVFRETGRYVKHLDELLEQASGKNREVIAAYIALKNGVNVDFAPMSETLFSWAQEIIRR